MKKLLFFLSLIFSCAAIQLTASDAAPKTEKDKKYQEFVQLIEGHSSFMVNWIMKDIIKNNNLGTLSELLNMGINNHLRMVPLHLAVKEQKPEACELLIMHGADVDRRGRADNGETPLMMACGNPVIAQLLLDNKADVNAQTTPYQTGSETCGWENERTALMKASEIGDLNTIKLLLERKADINMQDSWGFTAIDHTRVGERQRKYDRDLAIATQAFLRQHKGKTRDEIEAERKAALSSASPASPTLPASGAPSSAPSPAVALSAAPSSIIAPSSAAVAQDNDPVTALATSAAAASSAASHSALVPSPSAAHSFTGLLNLLTDFGNKI